MTDLTALKAANAKRWANAKLKRNFASVSRDLIDPGAKARYQAVSAKTGVPWAFIAVAHERECSQDWTGSLAQGDPWNRVRWHADDAGAIQRARLRGTWEAFSVYLERYGSVRLREVRQGRGL